MQVLHVKGARRLWCNKMGSFLLRNTTGPILAQVKERGNITGRGVFTGNMHNVSVYVPDGEVSFNGTGYISRGSGFYNDNSSKSGQSYPRFLENGIGQNGSFVDRNQSNRSNASSPYKNMTYTELRKLLPTGQY